MRELFFGEATAGGLSGVTGGRVAMADGVFDTTSWSLVVTAGAADGARSRAALESLCAAYWPPLYGHIRRRGYGEDAARDLTQAFFCYVLEDGVLSQADPERGRFRTFLLAAVDHFLANACRRSHAQRREGDGRAVPLAWWEAEARPGLRAGDASEAYARFDRDWAKALMGRVLARLSEEFAAAGKSAQFEALRPYLTGGREGTPYRQAAAELGLTEGALKVAVHRLRRRYALLLREEVARTVDGPGALEEELRYLCTVLGTRS